MPTHIPQDRITSALEHWYWNKEVEPQLRAAALRQTLASTRLLALRDPQLNPSVVPVADGCAVFQGRDAMGSFARELGTSRPVTARELQAVEEFYTDHDCPVRVWVSGRTHKSLLEMLHEQGYAPSSPSFIWLRSLESDSVSCEHPEIEIVPVPMDLYNGWIQTVAAGFFEQNGAASASAVPDSLFDLFFALGCGPDDQAFLAHKDGGFVGGAVLQMSDGIAMLRTASTRFIHRNSGVHQALVAARLKCAQAQGAKLAVSQSLPSGPSAHNLRKLGFQPLRSGCMMEKRIAR
jgi:hypothetical protein